MGFLGFLVLGFAVLFVYAGVTGSSPIDVLKAFLSGEPMPAPKFKIEAVAPVGKAGKFAEGDLTPGNSTGLIRPASPWKVTSGFGVDRGDHRHEGVDVMLPSGTPIHAAAAGRVTAASWAGTAGIRTRILHRPGLETVYMHQSRLATSTGASVKQGQVIGYSGNTGRSSGPHLHFEVHVSGKPVDPTKWV